MLKSLAAVMLGVVLSGISFFGLTSISRSIYRRPMDIAQDDKEALTQYFAESSTGEMTLLALSFILSAFIASYFASRKSEHYRKIMGMISGCFILLLSVSIFLYLPYPKAYATGIILSVILIIVLGSFLGSKAKLKA